MCGVICAVATDIISVWLNEVLNLLINELIRNNYKDKGPFLLIYLNKKKNEKHVSNTQVCRQIPSVKYLLLTVCLRQKLSLEYCKKKKNHSYKRPISFNKIAFFI